MIAGSKEFVDCLMDTLPATLRLAVASCRSHRSAGRWAEGQQFLLGQHAGGLLRGVEDVNDHFVGGRDVVSPEPVEHFQLPTPLSFNEA
jgi:hypothetical protein